jgi:hypothetical protein
LIYITLYFKFTLHFELLEFAFLYNIQLQITYNSDNDVLASQGINNSCNSSLQIYANYVNNNNDMQSYPTQVSKHVRAVAFWAIFG